MLIPPGADAPIGSPGGYGYANITNCIGKNLIISGMLADGTAISQIVPVSVDGYVPIYKNLYKNTGLLLGWINISSGQPIGALTWIKKPSTNFYSNGFTNTVDVLGSYYHVPAISRAAMSLTNAGNGVLEISGADQPYPLIYPVSIGSNNRLVRLSTSPTNTMSGYITPALGTFTVLVRPTGAGPITKTATGVIMQNATNAAGVFCFGTNTSGSVTLH
jgi:hypothetical protein